jgi:hypothetical protein
LDNNKDVNRNFSIHSKDKEEMNDSDSESKDELKYFIINLF